MSEGIGPRRRNEDYGNYGKHIPSKDSKTVHKTILIVTPRFLLLMRVSTTSKHLNPDRFEEIPSNTLSEKNLIEPRDEQKSLPLMSKKPLVEDQKPLHMPVEEKKEEAKIDENQSEKDLIQSSDKLRNASQGSPNPTGNDQNVKQTPQSLRQSTKGQENKDISDLTEGMTLRNRGFSTTQMALLIKNAKFINSSLGEKQKSTPAKGSPESFVNKLSDLQKEIEQMRNVLKQNIVAKQNQLNQLLNEGAKILKKYNSLSPEKKQNLLNTKGNSIVKQFKELKQKFETFKQSPLAKTLETTQEKTGIKASLVRTDVSETAKESPTSVSAANRPPQTQEREQVPIILRTQTELVQKMLVAQQQIQAKAIPIPLNNIMVMFPLKQTSTHSQAKEKRRFSQDEDGEEELESGEGEHNQMQMALIPKGPLLFGRRIIETNPFLISITPITNIQYAQWLTEQLKKKKIKIKTNGEIISYEGQLFCNTQSSDSLSQIQTYASKGNVRIQAVLGKELHPVVCVSFHGANAYCQANGFSLPTEIQWERAAGMDAENIKKKYLYGCSKDAIDPTCANYSNTLYKTSMGNLTTPVGFFNGKSVFVKDGRSYTSENAMSPFGCYDMCGNANCWTCSWAENEKKHYIIKGGSYCSSIDDVTVSSQLTLHPDQANGFTSFRVIINI